MTTKQMPAGSSEREFRRLAAIETDDCVIWPYARASQNGYGQAYVGRQKVYAHRAALALRVPQPEGTQLALHGPCHNPLCMNYRHLSWGTPTQNAADKLRDGTATTGERNPQAKLTRAVVLEMRAAYANGTPQRQLARRHGVSVMTVNRAIRGESWSTAA